MWFVIGFILAALIASLRHPTRGGSINCCSCSGDQLCYILGLCNLHGWCITVEKLVRLGPQFLGRLSLSFLEPGSWRQRHIAFIKKDFRRCRFKFWSSFHRKRFHVVVRMGIIFYVLLLPGIFNSFVEVDLLLLGRCSALRSRGSSRLRFVLE